MNVTLSKQDKGNAEFKLDNMTIAEILRVYLVEQGVDFAAWRREHPSKPVVLKIRDEKGAAKAVGSAISALKKDLDSMRSVLKK